MTDQTILYLLAALGWAGVVLTQIRRRSTPLDVWVKENTWGLVSGLVATATAMLIGPGDNVDLGSYVARTWAAGIAAMSAYLIGGNVGGGNDRRTEQRKSAAH